MTAPAVFTQPGSNATTRWWRHARRIPIALVAVVLVGCAMVNPPRPTTGLGSRGPCTSSVTTVDNPTESGQTLNVYVPGGPVAAPTGGRCDDNKRPTAIVVHGLLAGSTTLYADLIGHLVAKGNVVIFATYNTDSSDFVGSFQKEDAAIVAAAALATRADLSRVGLIGHSMGAGAVPYLVQQLAQRGWGTNGLWVMALAPWTVAGVNDTGPIVFPANAQVVVEAYSQDDLVQRSVGVDMFNRITTPSSQKQHVTLNTTTYMGETLSAFHTTPNSVIYPENAMRFYGIYRIADALQGCSQRGVDCATDFSFMGNWLDGTPVLPATSTDTPAP